MGIGERRVVVDRGSLRHRAEPRFSSAKPQDRLTFTASIFSLQRSVGNATVTAYIQSSGCRGALVVQRQGSMTEVEYLTAVEKGDYGAAVTYLASLGVAKTIKEHVEWLASEKVVPMLRAVPDGMNRVRAPLLDRAYQHAVRDSKWAQAAQYLNGFNDDDISTRMRSLEGKPDDLKKLAVGARKAMPDWSDRVIEPIRAILKSKGIVSGEQGRLFGNTTLK